MKRTASYLSEGAWHRRAFVAVSGVAALTVLSTNDLPFSPVCPFHIATGLWCPGCGLTRASVKLVQLDFAGALRMNIFAPVFVAMFLWATAAYVFSPKIPRPTSMPSWVWRSVLVAALLFGVVRNLPGLRWLHPI